MTDYLPRAVKTLLICAVVILSVALVKNYREPTIKFVPTVDPNFIPSARQIQQRLKNTGKPRYDPGKIDGVIGKDSIIAWDAYTCDQYAIRDIEGR